MKKVNPKFWKGLERVAPDAVHVARFKHGRLVLVLTARTDKAIEDGPVFVTLALNGGDDRVCPLSDCDVWSAVEFDDRECFDAWICRPGLAGPIIDLWESYHED